MTEPSMKPHKRYGLTEIINAAGTFTPLGVSRSSPFVSQQVASALQNHFVMDELQDLASTAIAKWTGAQAATVTHCVASAITLATAATMTGNDPEKITRLPETTDLPDRVVLPAAHAVFYGQPITQAIRLAGAIPVLAGSSENCSPQEMEEQLSQDKISCLLLVSSRLTTGRPLDLQAFVSIAHKRGIPAIIDCAAQDMRLPELLATGADLLLVSAQKYLASPTAGLVIGRKDLVQNVRAQEKGIGRAMKASKEAILGVLAAIEERQQQDPQLWQTEQAGKLDWFLQQANKIAGLNATKITDQTGAPFSRASLTLDHSASALDASTLVAWLKSCTPSIRVMEYALANGEIILELVPLSQKELKVILAKLSDGMAFLTNPNNG